MVSSENVCPTSKGSPTNKLAKALSALVFALLVAACGGGSDDGTLPADATLQQAAASSMGDVTSVRFELERTGAPLYIDPVNSLSLDGLTGRFQSPKSADALVAVTALGTLKTELGAVAIDDEIWMSNPITGKFETLPAGFDIDPSRFFDPVNGWRPLFEELTNFAYVQDVQRNGGTVYEVTGTATAESMGAVTAGLVADQAVDLTMWLDPSTALVDSLQFETTFDGETSQWAIKFTEYGETFEITDPTLSDAE